MEHFGSRRQLPRDPVLAEYLLLAAERSRRGYGAWWQDRVHAAAMTYHDRYPFFVTLTIADEHYRRVCRDGEVFKSFYGRVCQFFNEHVPYIRFPERGSKYHRFHMHCLFWLPRLLCAM